MITSKKGPLLGPTFSELHWEDTKDPCPVFAFGCWHIYGSGGSSYNEKWDILHATSNDLNGPWQILEPVVLNGVSGDHVAAPGMVLEEHENLLHMFVQTDFTAAGGRIEHLVSGDGKLFIKKDTAINSRLGTDHACIYDPHPAVIKGQKYLVYSSGLFAGRCDLFLAKSTNNTWDGLWESLGKILSHEQVSYHHNQHDHPQYEWGLEGPQLIELPNGLVLLNAVSFLPQGLYGTKQRVFFAVAKQPQGPYVSLGPVIDPDPLQEWQSAENGHATALLTADSLELFYQARKYGEKSFWRYGIASFNLAALQQTLEQKLKENG